MATSEQTTRIDRYEDPERVLLTDAYIGLGVAVIGALTYVGIRGLTIFTLDFVIVLGAAIVAVPLLHGLLAPRGITLAAALKGVRYAELDGERPFARHQLMLQLLLTTLVVPGAALVVLLAVIALAFAMRDRGRDGADEGAGDLLRGVAAAMLGTKMGDLPQWRAEQIRQQQVAAVMAPTSVAEDISRAGRVLGVVRRPLVVWR